MPNLLTKVSGDNPHGTQPNCSGRDEDGVMVLYPETSENFRREVRPFSRAAADHVIIVLTYQATKGLL